MRKVNTHEAKTHLSRLVEEAARGEPFVIAKAGKPMVKVVPLEAAAAEERLPRAARVMIADEANTLAFSVVSFFEVVLKAHKLCEEFGIVPREYREDWLDAGYREIAVTGEHAIAVGRLPALHKDPFDRLLVAQAAVEGATLPTADRTVARYAGPVRFVG